MELGSEVASRISAPVSGTGAGAELHGDRAGKLKPASAGSGVYFGDENNKAAHLENV